MISADELTTLSSIPGNAALRGIHKAVRAGESPTVVLQGFEVAEMDTKDGVLYLHDDLISRYPISNLLKDKNHPILRFKIRLRSHSGRC